MLLLTYLVPMYKKANPDFPLKSRMRNSNKFLLIHCEKLIIWPHSAGPGDWRGWRRGAA